LTACEDYFDRNPTQWKNHSHRIVFALNKTKGNKVAPFSEKYRKVMGGIGGFTRDPDYSTWERFRQEIIKRYIGIEEERRALAEMDKISYQNRIDTYLLRLDNLNIKAGLRGIAWRVRVESKLPEEILRRLSYYKFANDEEWMETLREVGRQEEELLERKRLSKPLTTTPLPKRRREGNEKESNPRFEKKDYFTNKRRKGQDSKWKNTRSGPAKPGNDSKDEHTDWKSAHDGIPQDVVDKRKKENRCTRCNLDNHTWRKCRKTAVIATTFRKENFKRRAQPRQRTSVLAVHQPRPTQPQSISSSSQAIPKVNRVHRELPSQIWELSDSEMT
jgi:hypothetical protein